MMTHAMLLNPNRHIQRFTILPVRARERQIHASERASSGESLESPSLRILPLSRTTDTLEVQILSCDVCNH